jgi:hypothetical protein
MYSIDTPQVGHRSERFLIMIVNATTKAEARDT